MPASFEEFARHAYPASQLRLEATWIWTSRVMVPVATVLAWGFARAGLTPNHVTYISLVAAGIGLGLVSAGRPASVVAGLVLVNVWQLLDSADGALARGTSRQSRYGGFIDTMGAYLVYVLLPLAVGVGLYVRPEPSVVALLSDLGLSDAAFLAPMLPLALGGLAAGAVILRSVVGFVYLSLARSAAGVDTTEQEPREETCGGLRGLIRWTRRNWFETAGFMLPLMVLMAAVGALGIWALVYGVVTFIDTMAIVLTSAARLRRQDRQAGRLTGGGARVGAPV